ncbi:DUF4126 [Desulfonema limicola]|uniref:DUF4126 n=1 Tax=Desulfonema limicola TaxID=45656 RepID=A0A975GGY5_9BACT|nr:DUF4126 domain-containing protein [Desulfonema limicola]QTA80683.1 DUF4126 [Desulfonema limicola]
MDPLSQVSNTIALSMGSAWASGINLYATILTLGVMGITDNIVLPENLAILTNPVVIGGAGVMFAVEFFADKIPGLDSGWDAVHTFIRIPAGALMAAGAVGDVNPALMLTAGIMGGGLTAGTHATKAGTRALINTSPEPFTNWTASVTEDVAVIGGVWTALQYPWLFIGFLVVFILLMIWLLPKLWRGIKKVFAAIGRLFGRKEPQPVPPGPADTGTGV